MEAAITRAQTHDELIAAITATYQAQSAEGWAQRIAEGLLLAELAAMLGITEDYPGTETLQMNAKRAWWNLPKVFQRAVDWFTEKLDKAVEIPVVYEFGERPIKRAPDVASAAQLDTAARLRARAEKGKAGIAKQLARAVEKEKITAQAAVKIATDLLLAGVALVLNVLS